MQRGARAQATTQGLERGYGANAAWLNSAYVALGGSGCAFVWSCTDQLRKELKGDLKPIAESLVALNTNVALMQQTLTAVQATLTVQQATLTVQQATLTAQQATLTAVQETLKAQQAKLDVGMLLVLGLLGTAVLLHKPK